MFSSSPVPPLMTPTPEPPHGEVFSRMKQFLKETTALRVPLARSASRLELPTDRTIMTTFGLTTRSSTSHSIRAETPLVEQMTSHGLEAFERAVPIELRGVFTGPELRKARKYFLQFDLDGSGTISASELATCLLQLDAEGEQIDDLLAEADFTAGEIGWSEFLRFLARIKNNQTQHVFSEETVPKHRLGIDAELAGALETFYARKVASAEVRSPSLATSLQRLFKEVMFLDDPNSLKLRLDRARKPCMESKISLVKNPEIPSHTWKKRNEVVQKNTGKIRPQSRKRDDESSSSEEEKDDSTEKEIHKVFLYYASMIDCFNTEHIGYLELHQLAVDCGLFSIRRSCLNEENFLSIFKKCLDFNVESDCRRAAKEISKAETDPAGRSTPESPAPPGADETPKAVKTQRKRVTTTFDGASVMSSDSQRKSVAPSVLASPQPPQQQQQQGQSSPAIPAALTATMTSRMSLSTTATPSRLPPPPVFKKNVLNSPKQQVETTSDSFPTEMTGDLNETGRNLTFEEEQKKIKFSKDEQLSYFQFRRGFLQLIALYVYPEKRKHRKACLMHLLRRRIIPHAKRPRVIDSSDHLGRELQSPEIQKLLREWGWPLRKLFEHYRDQDDKEDMEAGASKGWQELAHMQNTISLVEYLRFCRNFEINHYLNLYLRVRCFRDSCHSEASVVHLVGLDFVEWVESLARISLLLFPLKAEMKLLQDKVSSTFKGGSSQEAMNIWFPLVEEGGVDGRKKQEEEAKSKFHSKFMYKNVPNLYMDSSHKLSTEMKRVPAGHPPSTASPLLETAETYTLARALFATKRTQTNLGAGGLWISEEGGVEVLKEGMINRERKKLWDISDLENEGLKSTMRNVIKGSRRVNYNENKNEVNEIVE